MIASINGGHSGDPQHPYGNSSAIEADPVASQRLVHTLVPTLKLFGFDGVEVDFEGEYKVRVSKI